MKKVLCIAEVCCDIIFGQLGKIPTLGEEEYCKHFFVKAGGGGNTAMGLAKLQVPTRILTRVGHDEMGQIVVNHMKESGLDIALTESKTTASTPVSAVMSTKEDRCFASYGGDNTPFVSVEELEREIEKADYVHTYLWYCMQYPISELCETYNKTLSVDTSWIEGLSLEEIKPILSRCTLFTPNEKEAVLLTGKENLEEALEILAKIVPNVVITLGSKGSMALIDGNIHYQDVVSYGDLVDSTGAGDLYCSGLLYGFINGLGLKKSMEIASHIAGFSVTYYGGMDEGFAIEKFKGIGI